MRYDKPSRQEAENAIKNDAIIGLRILLSHSGSHCHCDECKAIRERLSMNDICTFDHFKIPQSL